MKTEQEIHAIIKKALGLVGEEIKTHEDAAVLLSALCVAAAGEMYLSARDAGLDKEETLEVLNNVLKRASSPEQINEWERVLTSVYERRGQ